MRGKRKVVLTLKSKTVTFQAVLDKVDLKID